MSAAFEKLFGFSIFKSNKRSYVDITLSNCTELKKIFRQKSYEVHFNLIAILKVLLTFQCILYCFRFYLLVFCTANSYARFCSKKFAEWLSKYRKTSLIRLIKCKYLPFLAHSHAPKSMQCLVNCRT